MATIKTPTIPKPTPYDSSTFTVTTADKFYRQPTGEVARAITAGAPKTTPAHSAKSEATSAAYHKTTVGGSRAVDGLIKDSAAKVVAVAKGR